MCSQLKIHETQPVSLANFHHFLNTSHTRFSVLQVMESWAEPENDAILAELAVYMMSRCNCKQVRRFTSVSESPKMCGVVYI